MPPLNAASGTLGCQEDKTMTENYCEISVSSSVV